MEMREKNTGSMRWDAPGFGHYPFHFLSTLPLVKLLKFSEPLLLHH